MNFMRIKNDLINMDNVNIIRIDKDYLTFVMNDCQEFSYSNDPNKSNAASVLNKYFLDKEVDCALKK